MSADTTDQGPKKPVRGKGEVGATAKENILAVFTRIGGTAAMTAWTEKNQSGCRRRRGNTLTCVHYIEDDKKTCPYHTAELKKLGFNFGTVFMSHDPNHGNPQTSQTDAQKMQDLGWTVQVLPKRLEPRSAPCQRRGCTSLRNSAELVTEMHGSRLCRCGVCSSYLFG
jgi:hypothetical protein